MSSIVPYLAGARRGGIVARTAYKLLQNPYFRKAAGAGVRRAARGAKRSFRSYKVKRKRRKIGAGTTGTRNTWLVQDYINREFDSRTLYQFDITEIARMQANDGQALNINHRNTETLRMSGWKFHFDLVMQDDHPNVINMAVIRPKNTKVINVDEFYRAYGDGRAGPFDTGLSGIDMIQSPINTDKYEVLWRKKLRVPGNGQESNGFYTNSGSNYRSFSKYLKFKRTLRYDDTVTSGPKCVTPIYLVFWTDRTTAIPDDLEQPNAFAMNSKIVAFFRNQKI